MDSKKHAQKQTRILAKTHTGGHTTRNAFLIVILLSILPFIGILINPLLLHTSDGGVQIPRMAAFYKAVADHEFPVRWAGDLNYGYGLPLFNFIYHTPFYISTFLIALGLPLILTFKLVLVASFLFSGIFFFLFAKEFFEDDTIALFSTILYQFAPFRFVEITVRGAIGGIYAYTFLPLVLFGIVKLSKRYSNAMFALTAYATALLVLSHNSLALTFFAAIVLFTLLFSSSKQTLIRSLLALGTGLLLSAFYWLPALVEHRFTYGDLFMKDLYKVNFPKIINFFIPNPFDDKSLRISEISVHWGIVHTLLLIIVLGLVAVKKFTFSQKKTRIIIYVGVLILGSTFFMIPQSSPIWERISFLRQFQFPWRFLAITVFATALLPGIFDQKSIFAKKWIIIGLSIFSVVSTMYYWQPTQGYDVGATDQQFWNYPLNTTYFGETDVIWSAGPAKGYPKSRVEVIGGSAAISNFQRKTNVQSFTVESTASARLVSYTEYFPGWQVTIDNKKAEIQFQDPNERGLLTFFVPPGLHKVNIFFTESPIRRIADIVSLVGIIFTIVLLCLKRIRTLLH